jgi:hypothetical protein
MDEEVAKQIVIVVEDTQIIMNPKNPVKKKMMKKKFKY